MNKYDWSNVPKEVKWIATDEDGWKCYFKFKPKKYTGDWLDKTKIGFVSMYKDSEFQGNWQDSLEERPNEQK